MRAGGPLPLWHYFCNRQLKGKHAVQFLHTSVFDELAGFCVVKSEVGKPNFLGTRALLTVLQ